MSRLSKTPQTSPAHSDSDQSESAQSDSEHSAPNTPEDKSAHFKGTGGPLATPMELGRNVNDQIQIILNPQLLAAPKVRNSDPTPVAIPMGMSMQVVASLTNPPAAGRNDMIPDANNGVATAEVNTLVGDLVENHRREVHTPVVGEKRKGTKTAMAPKKITMHKKAPPQGCIWYTGMPVAKLYQTESE